MKRLAAFFLLALLSIACLAPAYARTPMNPEARAAYKRMKQQEKRNRKYEKAQQKAFKKMQKRTAKPSIKAQ